ncbi:MAG: ABC transporter permease [Bacteroidales bacterium]|nr:ABC transporter permease [Bacteroidales bacterium]MCB9013125.1 ABC transporter permease [Bacteroidales bacterium]
MKKIFLIIQREYLSRVRKKSFLVMTILGPLLFAAFMVVPAWLATMEDTDVKTIAVADSTNIFYKALPETEYIKFAYPEGVSLKELQQNFSQSGYSAILFIPHNILASNASILYSDKQPSMSVSMHIKNSLEKEIERQKLKANNIENLDEILKSVKTDINLRNIIWGDDGKEKESNTGLAMGIGYGSGMLVYFFIFLFGAQVMRGVIEEKTSRIVEVIVSSVRPFQLMMGKIIGIGLVGLTQFVLWVLLTIVFIGGVQKVVFPEMSKTPTEQALSQDVMSGQQVDESAIKYTEAKPQMLEEIFSSLKNVNFVLILGMFIFYFIGGFLLYASFFAIIGSAVDSEADTQQFMLPVTLPLIIAIFVMINTINNPEGQIAFWFSLIPLTSPIVMMVRIPFHPAAWEIILSAVILIITFIGSTWMAGKIYRTGILMYGKKSSYSEIWKWLRYKN